MELKICGVMQKCSFTKAHKLSHVSLNQIALID